MKLRIVLTRLVTTISCVIVLSLGGQGGVSAQPALKGDAIQTLQGEPPFSGTIFLDPDIITSSDPTTFLGATYAGQGFRTMFDRRVNDWVTVNAYLFNASFNDGLTAEIQVNPEFGSPQAALVEAQKYGPVIGQLPTVLRADMQFVWIHQGTQPFGGGNHAILIHTGQSALYEADGILEETLVHESSHTSLDATHAAAPGWLAAQTADDTFISTYARDNPTREDVAESFLPYLALRYRLDRISSQLADTFRQTIPNRIAYFDSQPLNMYPFLLSPDLSLTKAASIPAPQPDQSFNYILTITNNGLGSATDGQLIDTLPAGLTQAGPITLNPPGLGTVGTLPNVVTDLTLAAGQSITVTIPVLVNQGQSSGTLITNTATLSSAEITTPITASADITIADAPLTAQDDFALTPIDTPVTIYALGNDWDPNGDAITITAFGSPTNGTVNLVSGNLVYTPALGFLGTDVFTYTASTSTENVNATVTVVVAAEVFKVFLPLVQR